MLKQLNELQEKLHFKDEEMIRLTHEHNELNKTILQLNQHIDRLRHYEAKEYIRQKNEIDENFLLKSEDEKQQQKQHQNHKQGEEGEINENENDSNNELNDGILKEMNHHHHENHQETCNDSNHDDDDHHDHHHHNHSHKIDDSEKQHASHDHEKCSKGEKLKKVIKLKIKLFYQAIYRVSRI